MSKYHRVNTPEMASVTPENSPPHPPVKPYKPNHWLAFAIPGWAVSIIGSLFSDNYAPLIVPMQAATAMVLSFIGWRYSVWWAREANAARAARRAHVLCSWCPHAGRPTEVLAHEVFEHAA